ncbi:hypothetical protein ACFU6K_16160 [Kitasatospora sp. NPDC057512]|uniref:hypothetical protein n=1 Tax=Kitasatospora sp. NPDC057512 TaxID=3346154 RepID=UPI00367A19C0
MYPIALSLWRTCVPYIVAFLVVQAARLGLHLDNASVTSALVTGFGTAYYAVFRFLEHRFGTTWGWFLGAARPPSYQPPAATPPAAVKTPTAAPTTAAAAPTTPTTTPAAPTPTDPTTPPTTARPDYRNLPEGG